ncbi:MAG: VWA domain-containing protein [Gemmatimonadaceae bacterium]|nr:VWA domain-containing protein [Gemmatimonadaceae bacterium]
MPDSMQMTLRSDRSLLRATARSTRYLAVSLTAPLAAPRDGRLPIHVGIVLDRSGSMDGEQKFTLATQAVEQALRMLRPQDRFTLVVYDTAVDVIMPSTMATAGAKRTALQRLTDVHPRGGTDLFAGWMTAASQMTPYFTNECVNRMLLLTDGLANAGITEPSALKTAAGDLRARGIATTTFGVGEDFDERLLRDMAHEGGGKSYFIRTPAQIADLLTSELGEALEVVRRGAVLQLALPPGARGELLNTYRTTHAAGDNELRIELGDLTSGEELSLVVRLTFPEDREGAVTSARAVLADGDRVLPECEQSFAWTYGNHEANDAQPRDVVVDREVAALYAGRARAEATEANRQGDLPGARRVLEATARRIREYARGDAVLEALWRELFDEAERFSRRKLSAMEQKSAFFLAEAQLHNRDFEGKARRQRR